MDKLYANAIKVHLEKYRPNFGKEDICTLIDFLFSKFIEEKPLVDGEVQKGLRELGEMRKSLPVETRDDLLYVEPDLCLTYARKLFRDGVRIGARLTLELDEA